MYQTIFHGIARIRLRVGYVMVLCGNEWRIFRYQLPSRHCFDINFRVDTTHQSRTILAICMSANVTECARAARIA